MVQVGDRIGECEIVARLRSGGMATLYLGRQRGASGFRRHVAVKVVHSHLASDEAFTRMFVDEALLSARIDHPNVVHVEALGEIDGTHYLVMEYVDGCSLGQLLKVLASQQRAFSPTLAVAIAIKVADGLHAAHETRGEDGELLGVVHRDVSPQNILLSRRGHVTLIDFGVAKARGRRQKTQAGAVKGKLRYMAPEQALSREVDRRADIYALGIVLWEMLTGRPYVQGNEYEIYQAVRAPTPRPPSFVAEGISSALDRVVLDALAVEPGRRPQTGLAFRRALAAAQPDALAVDYEPLEQLVALLVGDELDQERAALPGEVSAVLEVPPVVVTADGTERWVKTASGERAPERQILGSLTVERGPRTETAAPVVSPRTETAVPAASPPPSGAAAVEAVDEPTAHAEATIARGRPPRPVSRVVGAAVLLTALVAGAVGLLSGLLLAPDEPEVVAPTPTPPPAPAPTPPPAAASPPRVLPPTRPLLPAAVALPEPPRPIDLEALDLDLADPAPEPARSTAGRRSAPERPGSRAPRKRAEDWVPGLVEDVGL